jgi:hypothetical protein
MLASSCRSQGLVMSKSSQKMVRKQFLVPPSTIERLERLAAQRGTSPSEIVRRAISSYEAEEETIGSSELVELVSARLKEAIKSTRQTRRRVARTLQALSAPRR